MNNFFCYLYSKFVATWEVILVVLGVKSEVIDDVFQEGILTVVGSDCVELPLNKMPKDFLVDFMDEGITGSCDPHQDTIDSKIKTDCNCKYSLKVKWDVSTVRTIYWRVNY